MNRMSAALRITLSRYKKDTDLGIVHILIVQLK